MNIVSSISMLTGITLNTASVAAGIIRSLTAHSLYSPGDVNSFLKSDWARYEPRTIIASGAFRALTPPSAVVTTSGR